jgi:UDP-3-O-[3-hydroxymyristoyl] glucosamine N-acyltransferase
MTGTRAQRTVGEIASLIGGRVEGDAGVVITGAAGIQDAGPGDITFIANPRYKPYAARTGASAIVTSPDMAPAGKSLILVENPSLAFSTVISLFGPEKVLYPEGIAASAVIGRDCRVGAHAAIGPHAVIEDGVVIGENTVVYGGCHIGCGTHIGRDCLLYPHVTVREYTTVGDRVIIHSNTTVGSDGFGYVTVQGRHHKIPQVGTVVIEDDVEIGANCAIDRARFNRTLIGAGTKIDNLVHIAHNVTIGKNCLIVAQVGISGSTSIGNNVVLAGQVGLVGHITVGDNAVVMAQSGVSKSVPEGAVLWGYPAKPEQTAKRVNACVQNLPRLFDAVSELKKRLGELEKKEL